MSLESKKIKAEMARVVAARYEMEFRMEELNQAMAKMQVQIDIQLEKEKELELKIQNTGVI